MAQSLEGTLIDPFNGQKDIETQTLRHTSEAFKEDPIRVLRLARLRARFGPHWKVHASTKLLIDTMHDQLKSLQPDRVYAEVFKVMSSPNSYLFFETLDELNVLEFIFPNIHDLKSYREGSVWHKEPNVFEHTIAMLKLADHEPAIVKFMILYHDIAKPSCRRLYGNGAGHDSATLAEPLIDIKLPSKTLKYVLFHIETHQRIFKVFEDLTTSKIVKLINSFKKDAILLDYVLRVSNYDKLGSLRLKTNPDRDFTWFIAAFHECNSYSPAQWIRLNSITNPEHIQQHIHNKKRAIGNHHKGKANVSKSTNFWTLKFWKDKTYGNIRKLFSYFS